MCSLRSRLDFEYGFPLPVDVDFLKVLCDTPRSLHAFTSISSQARKLVVVYVFFVKSFLFLLYFRSFTCWNIDRATMLLTSLCALFKLFLAMDLRLRGEAFWMTSDIVFANLFGDLCSPLKACKTDFCCAPAYLGVCNVVITSLSNCTRSCCSRFTFSCILFFFSTYSCFSLLNSNRFNLSWWHSSLRLAFTASRLSAVYLNRSFSLFASFCFCSALVRRRSSVFCFLVLVLAAEPLLLLLLLICRLYFASSGLSFYT